VRIQATEPPHTRRDIVEEYSLIDDNRVLWSAARTWRCAIDNRARARGLTCDLSGIPISCDFSSRTLIVSLVSVPVGSYFRSMVPDGYTSVEPFVPAVVCQK